LLLPSLPDETRKAILQYYPDIGPAWIAGFPEYLASLFDRWQLTFEAVAPPGWPTNLVYFVRRQEQPLVLKVCLPHREAETEQRYLEEMQGPQVARLIDSAEGCAILLERVLPGTPLRASIADPAMIAEALTLHQLLPAQGVKLGGFPTYESWLENAFTQYKNRDASHGDFVDNIHLSQKLFTRLNGEDCLLHGDLHHDNILRGDAGWVAIDPKGVVGPAVLECGRFFHNFIRDEVGVELTRENCSAKLAERFRLGVEVLPYTFRELLEVTFIDLTLAVTWQLNSNQASPDGLLMLEALQHLLEELD
jgi:streptomycin 6-kinase